jgi:hypothetical protein
MKPLKCKHFLSNAYISDQFGANLTNLLLMVIWAVEFPRKEYKIRYRKVASTSPSRFEANAGLFRLFVKGIFDAYELWPFGKKFIFELVMGVRTSNSTVDLRPQINITKRKLLYVFCEYRSFASTSPSCLEAHAGFFRLSIKGKFDVYLLWPFGKKLISWL